WNTRRQRTTDANHRQDRESTGRDGGWYGDEPGWQRRRNPNRPEAAGIHADDRRQLRRCVVCRRVECVRNRANRHLEPGTGFISADASIGEAIVMFAGATILAHLVRGAVAAVLIVWAWLHQSSAPVFAAAAAVSAVVA